MKKRIFIAAFALLLAMPVLGLAGDPANGADAAKGEEAKAGLTQEATEGWVTVKITYKNPEEWRPVFDVTMDSRYVDLDNYRWNEIAILYDDLGGVYLPAVQSSEGSGRHRIATIKFPEANATSANSFELMIKGVSDVGARVFKFETRRGAAK